MTDQYVFISDSPKC